MGSGEGKDGGQCGVKFGLWTASRLLDGVEVVVIVVGSQS